MNVKETAVTNTANFSLFMVNFSAALAEPFRKQNPDFSVLDLKSHYRGYRYASDNANSVPLIGAFHWDGLWPGQQVDFSLRPSTCRMAGLCKTMCAL